MPSGTPTPDLIVAELRDILDGLKSGEVYIDRVQTSLDNQLLARMLDYDLIDLRPAKLKYTFRPSKELDKLMNLISIVIHDLTGAAPQMNVHLRDMHSSLMHLDMGYNSVRGVKRPSQITHREIRLEFMEMPDLKQLSSGFKRAAPSAQAFSQALQSVGKAMSTGDMWEMNMMRLENLGTSIEPIVAYRDFYPELNQDGELRLYSRNHEVWPPYKKLRAFCRKGDQRGSFGTHDAPAVDCRCGIYAFDSPDHKDVNPNAFVFGEVYLWGEVLICDSGYRAEFAYPKTIFVLDNTMRIRRWMMEEIEEIYGVPALLVNEKQGQTLSSVIDAAIAEFTKGGGES